MRPNPSALAHRARIGGAHLPVELIDLDEIDQQLIDFLVSDGRQTNRALAAEVGLTDATVAIRIRRMVDNGVLAIAPQFDWSVAGFRSFAVAYIRVASTGTDQHPRSRAGRSQKTSPAGPRSIGERLALYPGIFSVEVTYGSADLVVMLLAPDDREMHQAVTKISGTPGVASVTVNHVVDVASWVRHTAILPYEPTPFEAFPDPPFELDEVDRGILVRLQQDGRESSREISGYVGVSDATVRARRKRMEDAHLLRVRALFDPFRTGRMTAGAHFGLVVSGDTDAVMKKLVAEPSVQYCATALGAHNLVGAVTSGDQHNLVHIMINRLWEFDGVQSVHVWPLADVIFHRSDLAYFG